MDEKLNQAPGRKLDGLPAPLARFPGNLRYRVLRMPENVSISLINKPLIPAIYVLLEIHSIWLGIIIIPSHNTRICI